MTFGKHKADRWLLVFGLLGLVFFVWTMWSDPSVREPGTLTRDQAVEKAAALWKQRGVDVQDLKVNATLLSDSEADSYLGKNDLRDAFEKQVPEQAPLVAWTILFYQEAGSASYEAKLDPANGKLVGYEVRDANTGRKSNKLVIEVEVAKKALQDFGVDVRKVVPTSLDASEEKTLAAKESATDVLAFEVSDWKVQDLKLHYNVTLRGGDVTGIQYAYEVPPAFTAWKTKQTTIGTILTILSYVLSFALFVLAFIFLFLIKQKKPFGSALLLTIATFAMVLVSNLNQLPIFRQQFLESGAGLVERLITSAIAIAVVVILSLVIAGGTYPMLLTGGMLVREVNPLLWTPWKSPEWAGVLKRAIWRGYLLAFLWLALQSVFYMVAQSAFGVWSENDLTMSPSNSWIPALFPLMGWMAGIQEEMTYRLFGVTFLQRYWKNKFLATLVPAMIWALGHSLYAVYPVYTRFVELTIFGVFIGYCYLWFGIETVILAHATFDIIQMVLPMLFSGEGDLIVSGGLFLISPVIFGSMLIYMKSLLERSKHRIESL